MKILVVSDSHKKLNTLARMVEAERPDALIHCGDHLRDGEELAKLFPDTPCSIVPGNCDFFTHGRPDELVTYLGRHPVLLTHGHKYQVKRTYDRLRERGLAIGVKIAFFGHTHRPYLEEGESLSLFNPGAAEDGRYGLVEIDGDRISFSHKSLDP